MTLDELLDLLVELGSLPSGEDDALSALDHGLQCAHELVGMRPDDLELQVAGLVHDIGHEFGPDDEHGRLGAEQVRPALGDRIASLVEAHVPAKRYLVSADPSYNSALSATSVRTLGLQGGGMSPRELGEFLSAPHSTDAVVLRRADDAAKVPGRTVPSLEQWIPVLRRFAR